MHAHNYSLNPSKLAELKQLGIQLPHLSTSSLIAYCKKILLV